MFNDLKNADHPNETLEPQRPLLYFFQHVALRQAAFINHPELIKELVEPPSDRPLIHFWSMACLRCEEAGLFADEAAMSDYWMEAVKIHQYTKKNGYTIYIVTMPQPEFSLESFFTSIVHKDGEPHQYGSKSAGTRYFTLEKADVAGPLLCEWLENGSRKNYGERGSSVPTQKAFADAVFDLLSE